MFTVDKKVVAAFTAAQTVPFPEMVLPAASFEPWTDLDGPFVMFRDDTTELIWAETADGVRVGDVTSVRIDETGCIRGFYGLEGQCHLGWLQQGICVPATLDTELAKFHTRSIALDDGTRTQIGFGTCLGEHARDVLNQKQVVAVQEDLSLLVAGLKVWYYEGVGIYVAGHVFDWVDANTVSRMRVGYPSGHWQSDSQGDPMDLMLFHWVTNPGQGPHVWDVTASAVVPESRVGMMGETGESDMSAETVTAAYTLVDVPKLQPYEQVQTPDGGVGAAVRVGLVGPDGEELVEVVPEIDGVIEMWDDNGVIYALSDLVPTGKKYKWTHDNGFPVEAAPPTDTVTAGVEADHEVEAYPSDVWELVEAPPVNLLDQVTLADGRTAMVKEMSAGVDGPVFEVLVDTGVDAPLFGDVEVVATVGQLTRTGMVYRLAKDSMPASGDGMGMMASKSVTASCCSTCAASGGSCGGGKKKRAMTAATDTTGDAGDGTAVADMAAVSAQLEALTARLDDLTARLDALETADGQDAADMQETADTATDAPVTASSAAGFPATVVKSVATKALL